LQTGTPTLRPRTVVIVHLLSKGEAVMGPGRVHYAS